MFDLKLKKLPIGKQTFKDIIDEDNLYIDKTQIALDLIDYYKYVFLARPRRFGKSLFVDTLKELFEGNKLLFKGLYAYEHHSWDESYPVISISFSGGVHNKDDLNRNLQLILNNTKVRLNISSQMNEDVNLCFSELIANVYEKYNQKVVILIDEYDKPILDNLTNSKESIIIRDALRDFYTKIKDSDRYIKFALLTGVSKFSKVSIFSGLNNLTDISLDARYGNICGYTQYDIETQFLPYLKGIDLEKLKKWYNGYNFLGDSVYNPFDILLFIQKNHIYSNYWFETGTPSFLFEQIKKQHYFLPALETLEADERLVNSFEIENLSLETLMFQTGYLTVKGVIQKRNRIVYQLDFPNFEVKQSFYDYLLGAFVVNAQKNKIADDLYDIFENNELEKLKATITRLFSSIAYNNFTKNDIAHYEGFYASILYAYFSSLGVEIIAEDVTSQGRIDLTIRLQNKTYIFEFKINNEDPLQQIKQMKYYQKYSGEVYIVGINFDQKTRNIKQLKWEKVIFG
jgi:hypothetical protein